MRLKPEQLIEKYNRYKGERGVWDQHYQECYQYMLPHKAEVNTIETPGSKRNVELFDSTALNSAHTLAGALHGILTNPNYLWFEYFTGNPQLDNDQRVRAFLQLAARRINDIFNNSNFQPEVIELFLDLVIIGTAVMSVEEDDIDIMRFCTRPIGEVVIEENNKGQVDEVYRCFNWDAKKLVAEFGAKRLTDRVLKFYEEGRPDKFRIFHGVYRENVEGPLGAKPYTSQWVLEDEKHEIEVRGFSTFPYLTPRWSKTSGEKYGRSPGMNALPDAKTANIMDETVLKGAAKTIDPPLQAPDDGFIHPIMLTPAGISFYRAGTDDRIEPIFNDARIDFGFQAMAERRERIRKAFYVDQLQLPEGPPQRTATEVLQYREETLRLLGPITGRMRHEFLKPLMRRAFDIAWRRGVFNDVEIPPELSGIELDVQYASQMARAQKASEIQNITRALESIAPFANADPTVLDNLNGDNATLFILRSFGAPEEIIRSVEEREQMREQRAQAQSEQEELARDSIESENMKNMGSIIQAAG